MRFRCEVGLEWHGTGHNHSHEPQAMGPPLAARLGSRQGRPNEERCCWRKLIITECNLITDIEQTMEWNIKILGSSIIQDTLIVFAMLIMFDVWQRIIGQAMFNLHICCEIQCRFLWADGCNMRCSAMKLSVVNQSPWRINMDQLLELFVGVGSTHLKPGRCTECCVCKIYKHIQIQHQHAELIVVSNVITVPWTDPHWLTSPQK